MMRTE